MKKIFYIILFALSPLFSLGQVFKILTSQTNLQFVNVLDYGAVGDSTTDNTTAIRNALAAIPSKGGTLYFPPGQYLVSDSLLVSKPTTILGFSGVGLQKNSTGGVPTTKPPTTIIMSSSTKNLFVINSDKCQIQNIGLWNSNTGTASTAGHALLINKGVGFRQTNVSMYYFYINEEFVNGYLWSINNCFFNSAVATNLIIRDNASHDDGDQSLTNSWFYAGTFANTDHILYTSGGGLKINNCKFNSQGSNVPRHCIQDLMAFNSSDLFITNSSFENFTGYGIAVIPATGVSYGNIIINGNEFGPFGSWSGAGGINIIQIGNNTSVPYQVVVNNNIFYNTTTGSVSAGVYSGYNIFQGGDYVTIGSSNTFSSGTNGNYDNIAIYRRSHLNFERQKTIYTIPSASSITYYQQNGTDQLAYITSNTTITIDTASAVKGFMLRVLENPTGGFSVTFDSNCVFTGLQTINTTANAYTFIVGYFDRVTNKVELSNISSLYLGSLTTTQKNAYAAVAGNICFDSTLGSLYVYNGSTWGALVSATAANTFSLNNTFSTSVTTPIVTTSGTSLTLKQTGDSFGETDLILQNRTGSAGAFFKNVGLDLEDLGLVTSTSAQGNLRFEHRSANIISGNTNGEFQFLINASSTNPYFQSGYAHTKLLQGDFTVASGVITSGIPGVTGVLNLNGSASGVITIQPQSSAGLYNFNLPTSAGVSGQLLTSKAGGSNAMTWSTPGTLPSPYAPVPNSYTLLSTDCTIGASGASNTQTLPTAVGITGRIYTIINIDGVGNTITVATTSSQTINGNSTYTLTARYKYASFESDGANWLVVGNN